ncbi:Glycoside hydrolase [Cinnamomum micranthum f. kanehirae]|uniref:Glycoside hydrolase n=1 Tax=Cinnamomum micranthum f. kanehirae TaxID=337451 RepID=A0A443PWN4_9MAGN|nr:Glycoside hydrolase [Cinnamomum micranthum f. kanehirae]
MSSSYPASAPPSSTTVSTFVGSSLAICVGGRERNAVGKALAIFGCVWKSHENSSWVSSKTQKYHLILMARGVACSVFIFLSILTICCSGTLVGFSYDARRNSATSSPIKTISFLRENNVSPSQIRVFVGDNRVFDSLSKIGSPVDIYMDGTKVENPRKPKAWAFSWVRTHIIPFLPHINISSIIVSSTSVVQNQLPLLLPTLNSIHLALKSANLDSQVKVSIEFPLSLLEDSDENCMNYLEKVAGFIRKIKSYIVVEAIMDGELSFGDRFVKLMMKKALSAATILHYIDIPVVLNVKSSAVPSAIEVAEFTEKMIKSIGNHAQIIDRFCGLFAEISPMEENDENEINREQEQIFPASHRELLNTEKSILATKTTLHDSITPPATFLPTTPITNPVTTPVTVPSTNPTPTIVTVPSTNPVTVQPMNPVTSPISDPATTPVTVPVSTPVITVPSTNPVTPPAAVPITNPVTAPVIPTTPPVTNPVTTYPISPPGGTPTTTPSTTPVIIPIPPPATSSPVVSGQSWCVAKSGTLDAALQAALDYACGIGGADCSTIQQTGSCYNPNSLQDHASYAFNSYYQKNPVPSSCDFGGTAMIVNTNPSSGSCIYPSSSSTSAASTSSSSSSSILNTDNSTGSTAIFSPPTLGSTSGSVPNLVDLQLPLTMVSSTLSFILGKHLLHW